VGKPHEVDPIREKVPLVQAHIFLGLTLEIEAIAERMSTASL